MNLESYKPQDSPAYQLWIASNSWLRAVRRALEPLDLTHVQFIILGSIQRLAEDGLQPTQAEVCRFAALDENMMSQVVKVLTEKGLIKRVKHPADGRAQFLELTEAGKQLRDRARESVLPATHEFFSILGDEVGELTRLLRQLNDRVPVE